MRPLRVTIAATYKRLPLPVSIVGNCEGPMGGQVEPGYSKRTEDHGIQHSWEAMPGLPHQEGYSKQGHKMAWRKNTAVAGTDATAFVLDALWFMGLPPATTIQEPCLAEPLVKGTTHDTGCCKSWGHFPASVQGTGQGARNPFLLQDIGQGKASHASPPSEGELSQQVENTICSPSVEMRGLCGHWLQ